MHKHCKLRIPSQNKWKHQRTISKSKIVGLNTKILNYSVLTKYYVYSIISSVFAEKVDKYKDGWLDLASVRDNSRKHDLVSFGPSRSRWELAPGRKKMKAFSENMLALEKYSSKMCDNNNNVHMDN